MSEPVQGGSEVNEAEEGFGELVVASRDAAMRFDAAKEVFDLPAVTVVAAMESNRETAAALGWDTGAGALPAQPRAEGVGIEPSVCHQAVPTGRLQHW